MTPLATGGTSLFIGALLIVSGFTVKKPVGFWFVNVTVSEDGGAESGPCTFAEPQLIPNNGKLQIVSAARISFILSLPFEH
jgi:hypothetical protein